MLRGIREGEAAALADLREFHPKPPDPATTKLADAQLVLARSYQAPSWTRLMLACSLIDAIWEDDVDTVRELVTGHPYLRDESATIRESNWGPPLTYASNLGRDRIISLLLDMGAGDLETAVDRATLQGKVGTARWLHK